ncbi:VCBS repeat-containing protein, partial [candidate division WOR-3 bacterium]|nr:VCBS repeat-containing protein [candidate division WOR-3 bacterium]
DAFVNTFYVNSGQAGNKHMIGPHIFDIDRDGEYEFTNYYWFNNGTYTEQHLLIWEHQSNLDTFTLQLDIQDKGWCAGYGDMDNDGLYELLLRDPETKHLYTMEQADSYSYPIEYSWNDTNPTSRALGISKFMKSDSIDRIYGSGVPWLSSSSKSRGWYYYTCTGNDQYEILNTFDEDSACHAMTVGDFDGDSLCDIIVHVYACTRWYEAIDTLQDSFEVVFKSKNIGWYPKDYLILPDIDRDGRNEIICNLLQYISSPAIYQFVMIENNGALSWDTIWEHTFTIETDFGIIVGSGMDYGDIDGDGDNELVICGGRRVEIWESTADNTFELKWAYEHPTFDMLETHVRCFDFNNNGYDEIVYAGSADEIGEWYTYIFEDSTVVLHIDSAVGYEGDIILSSGIDNDDYVIMYFSNMSNGHNINYNNIDSILKLNNNHTWLSGDGLIRGAQWNNDSTQLMIALSGNNGVPTLLIGDTIFPNRDSIKIYDNSTPVKGIVEIRGTFDPSGINEPQIPNSKLQTDLTIDYNSSTMTLFYSIPNNKDITISLYDITGRNIKCL